MRRNATQPVSLASVSYDIHREAGLSGVDPWKVWAARETALAQEICDERSALKRVRLEKGKVKGVPAFLELFGVVSLVGAALVFILRFCLGDIGARNGWVVTAVVASVLLVGASMWVPKFSSPIRQFIGSGYGVLIAAEPPRNAGRVLVRFGRFALSSDQ